MTILADAHIKRIKALTRHESEGNPGYRYSKVVKIFCHPSWYWIIDTIAGCMKWPEMKNAIKQDSRLSEFQAWELNVSSDSTAVLSCAARPDTPPVFKVNIPSTDYHLEQVEFWLIKDEPGWFIFHPNDLC